MSGSVAQIEDTANRQQSGTTQAAQDVEATKQAIDEMLVQIEGINTDITRYGKYVKGERRHIA